MRDRTGGGGRGRRRPVLCRPVDGVGTAAAVSAAAPTIPVLAWKPCGHGFQCATPRVPLNYRDPRGAQISIGVISHQATGPGRSLGWLFFNGGGPEPQISTMPGTYPILSAA